MKIKYFGTAAYEGVPALFCECRVCKLSRKMGGRNLRSRCQALVDGELLIDFNADTVCHYLKYGFDWKKICGILITHSHCDHLYPADIEMATEGYSHGHGCFKFYAAQDGYDKIKAVSDVTGGGAEAVLVEAGKRFSVGNYSVLPLWANHAPDTSPVFYSITRGNKRMLYAHDTGVFPEKSWELVKEEGHFDLLSLDCTGCLALGGDWVDGHMSVGTNLKTVNRMKEEGLIDDKTVVVINHFSHNGGQTYDELCEATKQYGITVSYDGLEIEF